MFSAMSQSVCTQCGCNGCTLINSTHEERCETPPGQQLCGIKGSIHGSVTENLDCIFCKTQSCHFKNTNLPEHNIPGMPVRTFLKAAEPLADWRSCSKYCSLSQDCKSWTFTPNPSKECYLKTKKYQSSWAKSEIGYVSGTKDCIERKFEKMDLIRD